MSTQKPNTPYAQREQGYREKALKMYPWVCGRCAREFSGKRLSELTDVAARQLHRKIKQLTGYTPVEYIRSIRIKKAALLLQQKKFTVSEVMYMVGFSNASYFSKCFQSEFGMSPKVYMEGYL